jgi:hypothetical protein
LILGDDASLVLLFYRFLAFYCKAIVLPGHCRVTQHDCIAVETSRESVPAAGLLFCRVEYPEGAFYQTVNHGDL